VSRLLVLAPNPVSAASTRFRLAQFFPALEAAGITPTLRPFLDDEGFGMLYQRGHRGQKLLAAARALAGRIGDLLRATRADAVLVHREAALVGPPLFEWLAASGLRRPILFDLDDPVWVPYASPTYGALLSRLLKAPSKALFTLKAAAHIIAGNPFIADFARTLNQRVTVIPTVVDTEEFRPAPAENAVPVLGWIGTPSSVQYLALLGPALRRLAQKHAFVVRIIGGTWAAEGVTVENRAWSLEREVADFQSMDIGLYPLVEDAWSVGKSGFKAIQYMACGVPVVASGVGVTRDILRDGENGFVADSEDAWVNRLSRLLHDLALRRRLGDAGRRDAVARWSLAAHAPRFVATVREGMQS
jgi:glycosyltransferase involved in cell wall biosynthesis